MPAPIDPMPTNTALLVGEGAVAGLENGLDIKRESRDHRRVARRQAWRARAAPRFDCRGDIAAEARRGGNHAGERDAFGAQPGGQIDTLQRRRHGLGTIRRTASCRPSAAGWCRRGHRRFPRHAIAGARRRGPRSPDPAPSPFPWNGGRGSGARRETRPARRSRFAAGCRPSSISSSFFGYAGRVPMWRRATSMTQRGAGSSTARSS